VVKKGINCYHDRAKNLEFMMSLAQKILKGDIKAAARLIRDIDDGVESAMGELKKLYVKTGKAHIVGLTGPPGVGKSTLMDKIIEALRAESKTVGVIAVDPTSPFSGGAILGDRIRMQRHSLDEGVFIHSLATRGNLGGISKSTHTIISIMDAMGRDVILVETVGVGQDEVDIGNEVDTAIVVLAPGLGDDIQAIKAGILEIGDIYVINKCDHQGADALEQELKIMLETGAKHADKWQAPIYQTEAVLGKGIEKLMAGIRLHHEFQHQGPHQRRRRQLARFEFLEILRSSVMKRLQQQLIHNGELDRIEEVLVKKEKDPYTLVEEIMQKIMPR
jgi:LAO/AO transport system kinase